MTKLKSMLILILCLLHLLQSGECFHRISKSSSRLQSRIISKSRNSHSISSLPSHSSIQLNINKEKDHDFDLQLALLLAGFSFEAYNERIVGKRTLGLDSTVINFTSSSFIRNIFSGIYKSNQA